MKPPAFEYHRPETLEEALALLERHGPDAKPLAGGQSLIPAMNFRLSQPAVLVDLNRLDELAGVSAGSDGGVVLGAMTRHRSVERSDLVAERTPLLSETMPFIAHPQIRNRGTVGGSIAHADPAAELPAVMTALGATFVLLGPGGERRVEASRFFTGLFATALEPGELLTAVEVPPAPPRTGSAFIEVSRRHGDYALVGVAAVVTLDHDRRCADARVTLLSVGDGPVLAERAAASLRGREVTAATAAEASEACATEDVDPPGDIHASADFRRQLARVLTRRALERAGARAAGGGAA